MGKGIDIEVVVPVQPHIKQYLINVHGTSKIRVGLNDNISMTAFLLLTKPGSYFDSNNQWDYRKKYSDEITLIIPEPLNHDYRFYVCQYTVTAFNGYINDHLKDVLFNCLDIGMNFNNAQIKTIISLFLVRNGMDQSKLNYEMLKKAYWRYRKKQNKFSSFLSPVYNTQLTNKRLAKIAELS